MRLSLRLQSLLDRCQSGLPVWDLCCDHGLLGLAALDSGRFPEVVFNDAVPHVIEALRGRMPSRGTRLLCARAEDIAEPLTGNVVVAGVGGEKIFNILKTHARAGRLHASRIIVCPEKDTVWLGLQMVPGYALHEETVIAHNFGVRTVMIYSPRLPGTQDAGEAIGAGLAEFRHSWTKSPSH